VEKRQFTPEKRMEVLNYAQEHGVGNKKRRKKRGTKAERIAKSVSATDSIMLPDNMRPTKTIERLQAENAALKTLLKQYMN
jgi:hypothetical protein